MSAEDVADDYRTAISDLDNNSKPLITMLTMLAEENKKFPAVIVEEVANRIKSTPHKLPAMYLIDSIVKNVGSDFVRLFGNVIANLFSHVFKEVDERTRKKLYELRQTWTEVFPSSRLYMLDVKIHEVDPAWPMSLQPKLGSQTAPNIHVNPNKFSHQSIRSTASTSSDPSKITSVSPSVDDLTELKRLQSEKRVLEVERKIIEKQIMNENVKAIEPLDKMHSLEPKLNMTPNRQPYMKNYKIKKKPQTTDEKSNSLSTEKKVMSNIHVAPWKVNEILPKIAGSSASSSMAKDSRPILASPRDPRIPYHDNKTPHRISNKEPPKDPRLLPYKEQQKMNISNESKFSPVYDQPAVSRGKWVTGKSEPVTQTINTGLKNVSLNARSFPIEPVKSSDTNTSGLKKPAEIKKITKEKQKYGREEIVSTTAKRDIEPKISHSPHRKIRKDADEKILKEKLDLDKGDNKDKIEREKKDNDEKDNKVKEEMTKDAKDFRDKNVKDDSEKKFQNDWCKKVKEARERKEENNKRLKEEREKLEKLDKEKKDKDERVKRDKDERDKKGKDERDKKSKDERDKKGKDERDKKDRDERDKKDRDERDKKDKEERDRIEKVKSRNDVDERNNIKGVFDKNKKDAEEMQKKDLSGREKKDIDDRNVIETNVIGKKDIDDRDKKNKDNRDRKDNDDKEEKDTDDREKKAKEDKEKCDKFKKEIDESNQKDKGEREKPERSERGKLKEEIDKLDKNEKDKEEIEGLLLAENERKAEENKLRLIERKKTEELLNERYEQAMREAENESKLKLENEKKTLLEKVSIVPKQANMQRNEVASETKKKDLTVKRSIVKDEPKQKVKLVERKNIAKDNKSNCTSKDASDKGKEKLTKGSGRHGNKLNNEKKNIVVQAQPVQDDKFKVQTDISSRRREHIRPREKTPEKEVVSNSKHSNMTPSKIITSSGVREASRLNKEKDVESDDSDHYDANKPPPSTYTSKKAKTDEIEMSKSISCLMPDASGADTDLRILPSQSKSANSANDVRQKSSSHLGDLFGTCDTDLRQLPPATIFPHNQLPVNATGILPGVVIVNPFIPKPDQDLRETLVPAKARDVQENKDIRLSRVIEEGAAFPTSPGEEKETIESDLQSKKHSFSSPHSAKWAEFRGKNPEFQEYQRQAGISEKLEMFMAKDGSNFSLDVNRPPSRSGVRLLGRRGKLPDVRRVSFSSHDDDWFFENKDSKSEESYQFKINQLNEQFKKGDIPEIAYMRMMEDIRIRIEQDKIREVQQKERDGRPFEGSWMGESPNTGKGESENISRPFDGKQRPYSDRFHDRKWQPFMRGMHRDHPTASGPSSCGIEPKVDDEWTGEVDLPTLSAEVLRTVSKESETMKIEIDGSPREIRTYGEKAIVLMEWDDPRTLEFEAVTCDVIFDEGKFTLTMSTRDGYRNLQIDRETHEIKLGVPTQELMIDGKGYQCFFGGKPISVYLAGKDRTIRLSGKPPKVDIGTVKNLEYLVGKVQLIINAKKIVHLYLDAKPQKFTIDGMPFVLKFIDFFQAVNINGVKFPITFGGLPISISVRGYRRFLRFSALPAGIIPGKTSVRGMDADGTILIPDYRSSPPPNICGPSFPSMFSISPGQIPPISRPSICNPMPNFPVPVRASQGPSFNEIPPPLAPPPFPILLPPPRPPHLGTHQISQRVLHPPASGVIPGSYLTTGTPLQSQNIIPVTINMSVPPPSSVVGNFTQQRIPSIATPVVDIQSLLNNLVKTGLIDNTNKKDKKDELTDIKEKGKKDFNIKVKHDDEDEEEDNSDDLSDIPPLETMFNLENLRKKNVKLIKKMYRGMQCSSCGLRYPPDQTAQYSHHLDWHFRMNKKQQESTKKVNTRKFYLCIEDWLQYEEIEDLDERVPSMFEMEGVEDTKHPDENDEDVEEEVPSVSLSASSDPCLGVCPICHETFSQFYHQSTEDWHYKNAIQIDGINYHPACHQDLVKSQKNKEEKLKKEKEEEEKLKNEQEEKLKKEQEEEARNNKVQGEENFEKGLDKKDEMQLNVSEKVKDDLKEETTQEVEELNKEVEEIKRNDDDEDDDIVEEAIEKAAKIEIQIDDGEPIENSETTPDKKEALQQKNADSKDEMKTSSSTIPPQPDSVQNIEVEDKERKKSFQFIFEKLPPKERSKMSLVKTWPAVKAIFIINGFDNIKIKDEPMDSEVGMTFAIIPRLPSLLADIPIKMEIPDDDGRYEDDIVQTFDIDDDELCDDTDENEKLLSNDSWNAQTTTADIAISIDGNTELLSQPEATQPSTCAPKIKISVSKPSMVNNVDNLENHNSLFSEKDFSKIPSFLDEFSDIFEPPPFTIDLKVKPAFEGVELIDQPTEHRGLEMSSLCSIM